VFKRITTPQAGLIAFLGVLTVYRAVALVAADLPLFLDEAYYFDWSRTLDFGYFSKPPLIAWLIAASTNLCGVSEFCVRTPALVVQPLTAFGIFLVGRVLYEERVGWLSAVLYSSLPMVSASSWIMSTDAFLLLFWTYALWFLVRALEKDQWLDWLGLGVCLGFGLLAKYTLIAFPLSLGLYLAFSREHRPQVRNPKLYVALLLALILLSPNLVWNATHGLVSFRHTAHSAGFSHSLFHPAKLIEFLAAQMLVFGPVLAWVWIIGVWRRPKMDWQEKLLLFLGLPLLLTMSLEALAVKANANWSAPSYVTFTILVAYWLHQQNARFLFNVAFVLNLLFGSLAYHYDVLYQTFGAEPVRRLDPYARFRGWRELATEVQRDLVHFPEAKLLGDDRAMLAELGYYLRPAPAISAWNPTGVVSDHYRLRTVLDPNQEYLFVSRGTDFESVAPYFEVSEKVRLVRIPTHRDSSLDCQIYWVKGFHGYQ